MAGYAQTAHDWVVEWLAASGAVDAVVALQRATLTRSTLDPGGHSQTQKQQHHHSTTSTHTVANQWLAELSPAARARCECATLRYVLAQPGATAKPQHDAFGEALAYLSDRACTGWLERGSHKALRRLVRELRVVDALGVLERDGEAAFARAIQIHFPAATAAQPDENDDPRDPAAALAQLIDGESPHHAATAGTGSGAAGEARRRARLAALRARHNHASVLARLDDLLAPYEPTPRLVQAIARLDAGGTADSLVGTRAAMSHAMRRLTATVGADPLSEALRAVPDEREEREPQPQSRTEQSSSRARAGRVGHESSSCWALSSDDDDEAGVLTLNAHRLREAARVRDEREETARTHPHETHRAHASSNCESGLPIVLGALASSTVADRPSHHRPPRAPAPDRTPLGPLTQRIPALAATTTAANQSAATSDVRTVHAPQQPRPRCGEKHGSKTRSLADEASRNGGGNARAGLTPMEIAVQAALAALQAHTNSSSVGVGLLQEQGREKRRRPRGSETSTVDGDAWRESDDASSPRRRVKKHKSLQHRRHEEASDEPLQFARVEPSHRLDRTSAAAWARRHPAHCNVQCVEEQSSASEHAHARNQETGDQAGGARTSGTRSPHRTLVSDEASSSSSRREKKEKKHKHKSKKKKEKQRGRDKENSTAVGDAIKPSAKRRTKWCESEVDALLEGVRVHGPGKWAEIRDDRHFRDALEAREADQLRDKWRNLLKLSVGERPAKMTELLLIPLLPLPPASLPPDNAALPARIE